jgi:hypothetical protein
MRYIPEVGNIRTKTTDTSSGESGTTLETFPAQTSLRLRLLTVPGHADGEAFLEAAVLTSIPVQPDDQTFPVP